jgi:hypothetical protein
MNDAYFQLLWMLEGESGPCELAALVAALRCVTEAGDPNADYDDVVLPGVAPARFSGLIPQRSTKVAALQTGLTPIDTVNGEAKIVRSITTKCLDGTAPDYRTLDTGQAVVPNRIRLALAIRWKQYKKLNPVVADDPAPEQKARRSGIATPSGWNVEIEHELREWERGDAVTSGLPQIIDVELNPPASGWRKENKCIMSKVPVVPAPRHHQVGVSVQQL